jgi:hypothetical protein
MMHILAVVDIYTTDAKMMLRVNFCGFLRHGVQRFVGQSVPTMKKEVSE